MRRSLTLLLTTLIGISTFACGCTKPDTPSEGDKEPQPQPTVERTDLFAVKSAEDIAYRIPSIAVTQTGRLIAVVSSSSKPTSERVAEVEMLHPVTFARAVTRAMS